MSAKFVSMMMLLLLPALTEAQQVAKCPNPARYRRPNWRDW